MNDSLPPPAVSPAAARRPSLGVWIAIALVVVLSTLGGGGYIFWQQLQQMAQAKPQAPAEITQALTALQTQMERQRSESAQQLQTLQQELAAVKAQAAAVEPAPDMNATLAPVQEKLDAIVAQLEEKPVEVAAEPAAPASAVPVPPTAQANLLADYFALRRAALSGGPYAAELAVVIPQLADTQQAAISELLAHAELGIDAAQTITPAIPPTAPIAPWMQQLNTRLDGLVYIRRAAPEAPPAASITDPRREVLAALDAIGASITQEP